MILDEIAEYTKERVQTLKAYKSLYAVRDEAEGRPQGKDFRAALAAPGLSVIAELKQASPLEWHHCPRFCGHLPAQGCRVRGRRRSSHLLPDGAEVL